jgi:hypothetical protein
MKTVVVLLFLIGGILLGSSLSLSSSLSKNAKNIPKTPLFHDRRAALATALPTTLLLLTLATAPNLALALTVNPPLPQGITTVVLDSPESKIGVQLYDVQIGSVTYPAVKSVVSANGEAALQGVQAGMIVLSSSSSEQWSSTSILRPNYRIGIAVDRDRTSRPAGCRRQYGQIRATTVFQTRNRIGNQDGGRGNNNELKSSGPTGRYRDDCIRGTGT